MADRFCYERFGAEGLPPLDVHWGTGSWCALEGTSRLEDRSSRCADLPSNPWERLQIVNVGGDDCSVCLCTRLRRWLE